MERVEVKYYIDGDDLSYEDFPTVWSARALGSPSSSVGLFQENPSWEVEQATTDLDFSKEMVFGWYATTGEHSFSGVLTGLTSMDVLSAKGLEDKERFIDEMSTRPFTC
jgi:hypothetical protein